MNRSAIVLGVLCLTTAAPACFWDWGDDDDDPYDYYYDVPVTTAYWDDWSTSTVYGMSDPFEDPYYYDTFLTVSQEAPDDPDAAAEIVAENVGGYFADDCAAVDQQGSMLTVTLTECAGPFSDQTLDGTLRVSFRTEDDEVAFDIASTDLTVDGNEASITAEAVYREEGGEKAVQYTSRRTFIRNDRLFTGDFESTLTWTAGSACVTSNSSGEIASDDRTADVQVEDYTRCAGECPTSGTITLTEAGTVTTLRFSGGAEAELERADGEVQSVEFVCD